MTRRPEALGWKLTGLLQRGDQHSEIEIWSEGGAARQLKIDGKSHPQLELAKQARILWLIPSMDRLWIEGAEGRRRFLDRMALSFFPSHGEATLAYEKAMRERNRLLKDQQRDAFWYKALEAQMAEHGAAIHANRLKTLSFIADAQAQAETAFPTADLELTQSEGEMPETEADLIAAFEESRFRDIAAGRSLVGPHRTDLYGVFAAKGCQRVTVPPGNKRPCWSRLSWPMRGRWRHRSACRRSYCWMRSQRIWMPPDWPHFTMKSVALARRPG